MNQLRLALSVIVFVMITYYVQAHYQVEWLRQAPQPDGDSNTSVFPWANDCNGTSYECGWLQGEDIGFGDDQFAQGSSGHIQAFVTKYLSNGTVEWTRTVNSTSSSACLSIVIVEDGVIFGGAFEGNVTWNDQDFTGASNERIRLGFVAKLFSDGSHSDFAIIGSPSSGDFSEVDGLDTDANGNLFVTGTFNGSLSWGQGEITSSGDSDIFYVAYSTENGLFLFVNSSGGSGSDYVIDSATNDDGLTCILGAFQGTATFGDITLDSGDYESGVYVLGLNPDGTVSFASAINGQVSPSAVSINDVGHCTVVGSFNQTVFPATFTPTESKGWGGFFARYRTTGDVAIFRTSSGDVEDVFDDVSCDNSNGDCFIVGYFRNNFTFDSQTVEPDDDLIHGILLKVTIDGMWRDSLVASGNNSVIFNVCAKNQDAYFGGQFTSEVGLGDFNLTSPSENSFFYGKWKRIDA
jgi:hypothetical protein